MALLYPWATKEYLLWNMTIGQIVMYHNKGMDMKNGKSGKPNLAEKSASELRKIRDGILSDVNAAEAETKKAEKLERLHGGI